MPTEEKTPDPARFTKCGICGALFECSEKPIELVEGVPYCQGYCADRSHRLSHYW